jgi:hypothetical protein
MGRDLPVQSAVLVAPPSGPVLVAPPSEPLLARVKRVVAWSGWLEGEEG